jgi:hypothetical protein
MKFSEKIKSQNTPAKSGCSVQKIVQGDKKKDDKKKKKSEVKSWEFWKK